ncbi:uncharacterized protein LOC127250505 [Andrographis paniculata]|uniref:uncharacterized protein LOC127250505 n=1 Tax=Andrographis paniculata TaxID=175694 RepID=UPI0021E8F398|nr:uncharacterized protein LOC127250505 [Andrographis paniculata]
MFQHRSTTTLLSLVVFLFLMAEPRRVGGAGSPSPRPAPEDAILFSRWLVNQSSYGVLATLDPLGLPFGNVMSFSDGGKGIPYFYLTTLLDPTGAYALRRPRASLTLSEYPLGFCTETNEPQWPVCAKITLSGRLRILAPNSREGVFAQDALFRDHPQLAGWPTQPERGFHFFKLVVDQIFLVNLMAPARYPNVKDYIRYNNL